MAFATIPSWSTTAGTNTELDGISLAENVMVPSAVNNAFREMMSQVAEFTRRGSDLATASTLDLDSIDTMFLDLTGTTTVTAVTLTDGHSRRARATGAFQLTASSSLIVNGSTSTNYTTSAGDLLFFEGYGTGVVRVWALGGSVAAATTSAAGIVELATDAEARTATDTVRAITPSNRLIGTDTNNDAAAGQIGEYISSSVATGSAVSLTTGTPANVTSISLTAGDWDVSGVVNFRTATSTVVSYWGASISTTSATLNQDPGRYNQWVVSGGTTPGNADTLSAPVGPVRISLASTTTVFLTTFQVFTTSTLTGWGIIQARRVR